jgi:hypothetical protein
VFSSIIVCNHHGSQRGLIRSVDCREHEKDRAAKAMSSGSGFVGGHRTP